MELWEKSLNKFGMVEKPTEHKCKCGGKCYSKAKHPFDIDIDDNGDVPILEVPVMQNAYYDVVPFVMEKNINLSPGFMASMNATWDPGAKDQYISRAIREAVKDTVQQLESYVEVEHFDKGDHIIVRNSINLAKKK